MNSIILGAHPETGAQVTMDLSMANRHGLIAGATGTGKTVSLQILAEQFSKAGVPVFTADVKGDLSGISESGTPHEKVDERVQHIKIEDYSQRPFPTIFWDLYGEKGHPIRTTISEMGPLLLGRLMNLSDTQEAVLHMAFTIADKKGWHLIDLKDLKALFTWMANHKNEVQKEYGNAAGSTLASLQRAILVLGEAGGNVFFGEPALKLSDLMKKDFSGNGVVNVLDARKLMTDPRMYSTFLLWLISELFENLPEVGDPEKPKLVFFFDEAHLLFRDAPKVLVEKIEQVVRLIRSKGVGVFFVTQNPLDVPDTVRSQLGNRVQHALRAFTPNDEKAIKSAANTFRTNENFDTKELLTQLKTGYALVSTLDEKGQPKVVEHTMVRPPESRMGPITDEERNEKINNSPLAGTYEEMVDRESAHEMLEKLLEEDAKKDEKKERGWLGGLLFGTGRRQGMIEQVLKTEARRIGRNVLKKAGRGILGSLLK